MKGGYFELQEGTIDAPLAVPDADSKTFVLSRGGVTIEVIEFGARLRRCLVPDADGRLADVVPGFDETSDYIERAGSIGAVLGRYGNIISFGCFELEGQRYELSKNLGPHTMHGGAANFGHRFWRGRYHGDQAIRFALTSPDGDLGWPGRVEAEVEYALTDAGELTITMTAVSDRTTYLNLIFHGYWNLSGHGSGLVHDHWLRVEAETYTPKGDTGLPLGERRAVDGTPLDFRVAKLIGQDIEATGRGYADNLCLREYDGRNLVPALRLLDPKSGRAFSLATDQPGVQIFTGNAWRNLKGKGGATYQAHSAIAFETQLFPNTPNTPSFEPRPVLAGEEYRHRMVVRFEALRVNDYDSFLTSKL